MGIKVVVRICLILIGHSSGAVAILRYLETHRIEGAVIIGVCHTDLGDEKKKISGYYDDPPELVKGIKNRLL